jgi:Flp pilus assembly protein TadD/O-antigen ligase
MTMIEKILRSVVLGGVFIIPALALYVASSLFFPYITGKNFAFRIITEIVFCAWIVLALLRPEYRPRKNPFLYTFVAFVAIMAVANAFGAVPSKSFWSNFERMDGWITIFHLLLYYVVMSSTLISEVLWRRWFVTTISVSWLIVGFGLLQLAGLIPIQQGSLRLDATLGNAIYLAIYMYFHIGITAYLWITRSTSSVLTSIFYGSSAAAQTIILFFTATRGTMLALIGAALVTALIALYYSSRSTKVWRGAFAAVACSFLLVGGFMALKDSAFVQKSEPLRRLASISTSETTVTARIMNWGMAFEGFKERPLLGWGQENYNLVFSKYYNPKMYTQEPWFDRVHNIFFDWLVAGGLFGVTAYLLMCLAVLWMVFKLNVTPLEKGILMGLFLGYYFHNVFVFDNLISYVFFFSMAAYISFKYTHQERSEHIAASSRVPADIGPYAAVLATLVASVIVYTVNIRQIQANTLVIDALANRTGSLEGNLKALTASANATTMSQQESREQLMQSAFSVWQNQSISQQARTSYVQGAINEMKKQVEVSPLDPRFPFFLGAGYQMVGDVVEAEKWLKKAVELTPTKQQVLFQLGLLYANQNRFAEALPIFKKAYEEEPTIREAVAWYASTAIRSGDLGLAQTVISSFSDPSLAIDQKILGAYILTKNYSAAEDVLKKAISIQPQSQELRTTLAAVYKQSGRTSEAVEVVKQMVRDIPATAVLSEALVNEITQKK